MMAAAKKEAVVQIIIPKLDIRELTVTLVGDSPLVMHKWSEKAKREMFLKQTKGAKMAKEAKNPEKDYEDSMYKLPDNSGYGFPTIGFKRAAIDACSHADGITKVIARGAFHIPGELVKIDGEPHMREDMVRVGMGVADLRYRGEFTEWSCTFTVRYNASVISPDQIVNLFNISGFAIGIGENRPQKNGSWGMFHVKVD